MSVILWLGTGKISLQIRGFDKYTDRWHIKMYKGSYYNDNRKEGGKISED